MKNYLPSPRLFFLWQFHVDAGAVEQDELFRKLQSYARALQDVFPAVIHLCMFVKIELPEERNRNATAVVITLFTVKVVSTAKLIPTLKSIGLKGWSHEHT